MNKPVYLNLKILEIRKILRYEFLYDYLRLKYEVKAILGYMSGNFIIYIQREDIYVDVEIDFKQDSIL